MQNDWYKCWFDSPYYHLLYSGRDEKEAASFIDLLCARLPLQKDDKVWDMACGSGRHAQALAARQLRVTGTDLSPSSIKKAIARSGDQIEFFVHDMRSPFRSNYFNAVFSLFTSFGYFERTRENLRVFQNAHAALRTNGLFILDYFNARKVRKNSDEKHLVQRNNIDFHIHKQFTRHHVIKTINFEDSGKKFEYSEKVELLELNDFLLLAEKSGFSLIDKYGNYSLDAYDENNSDRLILIFKK